MEAVILALWLGRANLTLGALQWRWAGIAGGAEAASVVAVGALYRPLLRAGGIPMSRSRSVALGAAASAITATAPGGAAVASAYVYRQLRRTGGTPVLSGWSVAVADVLSIVAFGVIAGTAAALQSANSIVAAVRVAGIGLGIALALIGAAIVLVHHAKPLMRVLQIVCRRLPGARARESRCAPADFDKAINQISAICPGWRDFFVAFSLALLNWAADLACFVLSLHAVGIDSVGIGTAAAAYSAGLATTSLSLLPGGIGTVEAAMLLVLRHAGVASAHAIAGIVTYRVVAYAFVAGVGWAVWGALRRGPSQPLTSEGRARPLRLRARAARPVPQQLDDIA
jgi:hypothetical protein